MTAKGAALSLDDVEAFLWREADLLDAGDLHAWRDLFAEDGVYWMPVSPDQDDPLGHISIIYEGRMMMAIRAENFGHRLSASMQYPVRCSHMLSHPRLVEGTLADEEFSVKSNFQVVVYYREQTMYAGTCTHLLRRSGDDLLIARKRVDLVNCDAGHKSLVTYI